MSEEEQEVLAAVKGLVGDDEVEVQRMLARYEGSPRARTRLAPTRRVREAGASAATERIMLAPTP